MVIVEELDFQTNAACNLFSLSIGLVFRSIKDIDEEEILSVSSSAD